MRGRPCCVVLEQRRNVQTPTRSARWASSGLHMSPTTRRKIAATQPTATSILSDNSARLFTRLNRSVHYEVAAVSSPTAATLNTALHSIQAE
jgi:hypothetical protein